METSSLEIFQTSSKEETSAQCTFLKQITIASPEAPVLLDPALGPSYTQSVKRNMTFVLAAYGTDHNQIFLPCITSALLQWLWSPKPCTWTSKQNILPPPMQHGSWHQKRITSTSLWWTVRNYERDTSITATWRRGWHHHHWLKPLILNPTLMPSKSCSRSRIFYPFPKPWCVLLHIKGQKLAWTWVGQGKGCRCGHGQAAQ